MEYSQIAITLNDKKMAIETSLNQINQISFESIWSGLAYSKLTTDLKTILEIINIQKTNIETYISGLNMLQSYKNNKEKLTAMQSQLSNIPNTSENSKVIETLVSQINSFINANQILREKINETFQAIAPISQLLDEIGYKAQTTGTYITDVQGLYELFKNNQLTKIPDSGKNSLYDYYSEEEVEQVLNEVQNLYQGRDAAVNSALAIMQLAANVGIKLDYDWGGGHVEVTQNKHLATGVDCSAFASWAINQGSTETFTTRTTAGLIQVGQKIDYSQAQKGDILVYNNGENGHVVVVVENNPEAKTFIVAEAAGQDVGVILKERSYSSLNSGSYQARDLTEYYNN